MWSEPHQIRKRPCIESIHSGKDDSCDKSALFFLQRVAIPSVDSTHWHRIVPARLPWNNLAVQWGVFLAAQPPGMIGPSEDSELVPGLYYKVALSLKMANVHSCCLQLKILTNTSYPPLRQSFNRAWLAFWIGHFFVVWDCPVHCRKLSLLFPATKYQ